MPNYQAISLEHHGHKRWKRFTNYTFAAADSVAPIVAGEFAKAVMAMPIAFIEQDGAFVPIAVLALKPGNNVFVASDWSWLGKYVPAVFRCYPFRLAKTENEQQVLCINEESVLTSEDRVGEPFFDENGKPSKATLDVLSLLTQFEESRIATIAICGTLKKHDLICPWSITIQSEEGDKLIEGLFRIDEAKLNQLPADALFEIRQSGALMIAYCQLLSMQHLPLLGQLTEAQDRASAQALSMCNLAPNGELDLEFFNKGGTFNFGRLG